MATTDTNMGSALEALADRLHLVVPDEIRRYKQWVLWRYEPGEDKPRKVPYYLGGQRRSGVQGGEADLAQLTTFDEAVARFRAGGFDGVGLAVLPNSPIKAIDIDNCIDPAGKLRPEAEAIVNEADSYAEISPSGGGVRILVYGVLPSKKAMHRFGPGQHLELFGSSGFVTVTGNLLGESNVRPMSSAFQSWVTQQVGGGDEQKQPGANAPASLAIDERQRAELRAALNYLNADDYEVWTQTGLALKSLGEVGRGLWLEWSQLSPRFDAQQTMAKWATFAPEKITYQSIFYRASAAGWTNPMKRENAVALKPAEAPAETLPILDLDQLELSSASITWSVKHFIPADSVGVMFGGSGTFKSFIALDYALHVAHGLTWLGRKTRKAAVLFIAAEGGSGLHKRIQAWHQDRGLSRNGIEFYVLPVAVSLVTQASEVVRSAQALGITPGVVIVDTMSQTFDGEENSANEVASYLRELGNQFRALWRCVVMVIHHSGHQATERPRGSSAIRSNVDFMLGVFRDEDQMTATMECHKQKDGEKFAPVSFALSSQTLGHDEDGEAINSLAARAVGADTLIEHMKAQAAQGRGGRTDTLMRLVQNGMPERDLRRAFYEALSEVPDIEKKKVAFYRARDSEAFKQHFEIATDSRGTRIVIVLKEYA